MTSSNRAKGLGFAADIAIERSGGMLEDQGFKSEGKRIS